MSVALRTITRLQDADDINVSLGAGVDEYALCWDNDTSRFVLRQVGGVSSAYIMRDLFTTSDGAPIINPRQAEPGPGWWTVTDVEGVIKILAGRLRGGTQPTTAVWGESRLIGQQVFRVAGRVLAARITLQDAASDLAFGFATNKTALDPRANGHGWLVQNSGGLYAIADGAIEVSAQARHVKPMQYLAMIALEPTGAILLLSTIGASVGAPMLDPLGIPQYPAARVAWIDRAGAAPSLYPYVSFLGEPDAYPNGHAVEDVRIVDVAAWSGGYGLATIHDEFTRANSASSLGGNWVADAGIWGISSNQAYVAVAEQGSRAYYANSLATGDGIVMCDITPPTTGDFFFGLMLRRQDANNFIRLWNNGQTNTIDLNTWVGGNFGQNIYSMAQTWVAGQTYRVVVAMIGNKYSVWVDGVKKVDWVADVNSRFITATSNGLYMAGSNNARWDNFATYPLTVTIPAEIGDGAVPIIPTTGGTIASDTFTDTDATRLNAHTAESGGAWTEHSGTWTISSNKAAWASAAVWAVATQNVGAANVECSVDVTIPASLPDGYVRAGVVGRYVDAENFLWARLFVDDTGSLNEDEIELIESVSGYITSVVHKVSLANFFANATTYTLKLQFIDDLVHVFLNGQPLISYYCRLSATGTRFGLMVENIDDGCLFDNWSVKAL